MEVEVKFSFASKSARGSSPLSSTFLDNAPFGENVEGLSYFRDESYVDESKVQTDDFEQLTFCANIRSKPLDPFFSSLRGSLSSALRARAERAIHRLFEFHPLPWLVESLGLSWKSSLKLHGFHTRCVALWRNQHANAGMAFHAG
jgi:hypothetical protein